MKAVLFSAIGALSLSPLPAAAQAMLSLAEGAACAQSSETIESLEKYNTALHDDIGQKQASKDRESQNMANAMLIHYDAMVALRKAFIDEYALTCSNRSMSYSDYSKVCTPLPNGKSFIDTVFCKPWKEAQQ